MAKLYKSVATLRISGDGLVPREITELLGTQPTGAKSKGDRIVGKVSGHVRIAKTGMWRLSASDRIPADLDAQIQEIFGQTTQDSTVWRGIARRYEIDIFCGLFMELGNEGCRISAASMKMLAERGVEMAFDIYGGDAEES